VRSSNGSGRDGDRTVRAMTAGTIAERAGGRVVAGDAEASVTGVAIDSRALAQGDLFVALPGEGADGHAFLGEAVARGAAAVLVREGVEGPPDAAVIAVADPGSALLRLAGEVRRDLRCRVVAITGSSGKTITKEFTAAVARAAYRTVASAASFNNEIGVPLTLLAADDGTEVLVAEIGSRGVGHIASLMPVVRPDIGVVLNVGLAHVGMFGSTEAIAQAKGELVEGLAAGGTAVLNADDPAVDAMGVRTQATVLRFGLAAAADVRAEGVATGPDACATFTLVTPDGVADVRLRVPGEHIVSDALAAAATGVALGIDVASIAGALSAARGPAWRMEVTEAPGGWVVVNDAYNANPNSTAAALKTLVGMGRGRRTWAVLGYMAELGDDATHEHDRIGRLAVRLGISRLVAVGEETRPLFEAARLEGMTPEEATLVANGDEALALLRRSVAPGDVVLVKASRAVGLQTVALALAQGGDA
jgi:UDP-N-acetylmuramoyl-tripeptide--D-alanyl-D-alanine ligase